MAKSTALAIPQIIFIVCEVELKDEATISLSDADIGTLDFLNSTSHIYHTRMIDDDAMLITKWKSRL
jgi:hypothetical protein